MVAVVVDDDVLESSETETEPESDLTAVDLLCYPQKGNTYKKKLIQ